MYNQIKKHCLDAILDDALGDLDLDDSDNETEPVKASANGVAGDDVNSGSPADAKVSEFTRGEMAQCGFTSRERAKSSPVLVYDVRTAKK